MKATNSVRPLPHFDYVPTEQVNSDEVGEVARPDRDGRSQGENCDRFIGADALQCRLSIKPGATGEVNHGLNALRKALHELANKGQIDHFLKRGSRFLRKKHKLASPEPREEECSIEIMATIAEQEVNPTGMIRFPLHFGNKAKARNLEVDFLVVDIPTTYGVILGWPTLHQLQPSRKARKRIPTKNKEVEDGVEGKVEDTRNPIEDSKEAFEDAIESLKQDGGEAEPFSLENLFRSRRGFEGVLKGLPHRTQLCLYRRRVRIGRGDMSP
ncbi:hypothetical protein Cgig2_025683 [Carnegiea gigantea]|uniref:Uncharacterized protein n=1 Tax=Carnegiea gigantea TaxID=171969 RepID=A0A9Q1JU59_9CARY|nr:hypothetical protein Cgig2_025683 [Carnegiea gigantea]